MKLIAILFGLVNFELYIDFCLIIHSNSVLPANDFHHRSKSHQRNQLNKKPSPQRLQLLLVLLLLQRVPEPQPTHKLWATVVQEIYED